MKTTLGHWRQHLASWMCYILHTITCVSMLQLARFPELFAMSHAENIWVVPAQARWQLCSLRHTLRTCVCVKHECLCSRLSIDVVPALIFFQILAFPSSSVPHHTPSSLRLHCALVGRLPNAFELMTLLSSKLLQYYIEFIWNVAI